MFEQPHTRKKYSYYIMDSISQVTEHVVEPVVEPVSIEVPTAAPVVEEPTPETDAWSQSATD